MEPAGSGATWTGSPKGVFAGRKHHKPRLSLKNNTAGVCEREDANRTREAGNRDEVEGVVANTLNGARGKRYDIDGQAKGRMSGSERVKLLRDGAVGFIGWLDVALNELARVAQ
jgi:hypothetical protein